MASRWRAIPVLALLAVAGLIVAGLVAAVASERTYRVQRQQATAVQGEILAGSVTAALDFGDSDTVKEFVSSLRADSAIAVAAVFDARGKLVAGFSRSGEALPVTVTRAIAAEDRVAALVPVRLENRRLGAVYVESALQPLSQRLSGYWGIALLVVMGSIVVVVLGLAQAELGRANTKLRAEIAQRAKAEAALAQSQKMQALGQLVAGIAHDFNNLLTAVVGGLDLILRKSDDAKIRRLAETSIRAAERGTKLTGQLLAFSRTQKLELRPVAVASLVAGMSDLFRRTLGPAWEVRFDLDGAAVPVMADPTQLEVAILNLGINARDAMQDGGRVTVSTRSCHIEGDPELVDGEYLEIRVSDTGTGMSPEVLSRCFDPFFTTKGVGKGTGLGLSMVYGVARQSGGTARIQSELGRGTAVSIILPRAAATEAEVHGTTPVMPVRLSNRRGQVLVVDDDSDVREFVVGVLEGAGHRVLSAANGSEGLAVVEQTSLDVVVTDFAMPGMSGADLARAIRARLPQIPIVVISGFADSAALEQADREATILRKPFRADELLAIIDEALARAAQPIGSVG